MKTHTLSSGKQVHVLDDLLPLQLRDYIFTFCSGSMYKIGWVDGTHEKAARHKFLHSTFSEQDNEMAKLLPFLRGTEVANHIGDANPTKSVINLSTPSDTHFPHAHPESTVVLYYVNLDWEDHWHGETLFYSENLKDIELALKYTPGRIVVFDGSIPHSIRPQSTSAANYRFTYAMTFGEDHL